VKECIEFTSIYKSLTFIGIRTGHQTGEIADGLQNLQISFFLLFKTQKLADNSVAAE
jgi:hypothetical protein